MDSNIIAAIVIIIILGLWSWMVFRILWED